MAKTIWLISFLNGLNNYIYALVVIVGAYLFINIMFSYTQEEKERLRIKSKKLRVLIIAAIIISAMIPSKTEMYAMALVDDKAPEQIYQMTKDEVISTIDYFIESIDKLEKGE